MHHNLALPPVGQQSSSTSAKDEVEIPSMDSFMQSDDFLQMINNDDLANMSSFIDLSQPSQMQMEVQMPTPPAMEPNTILGPSYHPMVGWYFPALPSSGIATPVGQFSTIHGGYTPASSMPASAMPSGASTPLPYPTTNPPKSKGKKKWGPAAFLEEQAKPRLLQTTNSDLPFRNNPSQTKSSTPNPLRDGKNLPLVQTCVCTDKEKTKIKRPRNAFIIYRSANSKKIIEKLGHNDNQAVSKILGQAWQKENPDVKAKYVELAEQEKQRHEKMYPGYKYQPGQSSRNKFGSQSCTCGAFEANLRALHAKERGEKDDDDDEDEEFDAEDDRGGDLDEYVPATAGRKRQRVPQQQQKEAPNAPILLPPLPDPSTFGFSTPSQHAEAQAYVANLKRKRDQADIIINDDDDDTTTEQPLAKRRSPRMGRNSVTYTEPLEEDDVFDFDISHSHTSKQRPSQAGLGLAFAIDTTPTLSQAGFASAAENNNIDSPARNTRSKTTSPQLDQAGFSSYDFEDITFDSDWEKLFEASGLFAPLGFDADANPADDDDDANGEGDGVAVLAARYARSPSTRSRQKSVEAASVGSPTLRRSSRKVSK